MTRAASLPTRSLTPGVHQVQLWVHVVGLSSTQLNSTQLSGNTSPDYFTPALSDGPRAIVLLTESDTDIFGLRLPNPTSITDDFAEHVGVDVWVPDYFNGAFRYRIRSP